MYTEANDLKWLFVRPGPTEQFFVRWVEVKATLHAAGKGYSNRKNALTPTPNFPLDSLGETGYSPYHLRRSALTDQAQLLPGTLDLLILRAVSLGPLHGYGVLLRIGQISGNALLIEQGALYPGLFRLVRRGLLEANWGTSENNRRAKFYELTAAGRKRLREETEGWNRLAAAMTSALSTQPEDI